MPCKPFDWSIFLDLSLPMELKQGSQIFHFNPQDKVLSEEGKQFIKSHLMHAAALKTDADVLRCASDAVVLSGAYIEMGVCTGRSINFLAALNPTKKLYGFDSFEGLPEDWKRPDLTLPKETFAFKHPKMLPPILPNVKLFPGWFKDSLPEFKENILQDTPIALLHIDCDLYSSTKEVFHYLGENLKEGSVIVFDEYYNFPGYEEHEYLAFQEFLQQSNFKAKYLYYNVNHEQVAIILQ